MKQLALFYLALGFCWGSGDIVYAFGAMLVLLAGTMFWCGVAWVLMACGAVLGKGIDILARKVF